MNGFLMFLAGIVAADPKARAMVMDGVKWVMTEAGKAIIPQKGSDVHDV